MVTLRRRSWEKIEIREKCYGNSYKCLLLIYLINLCTEDLVNE